MNGRGDYHSDDQVLGKVYDIRLMKRLFKYAWSYYRYIGLALLLALSQNVFVLAGPMVVGLGAIDQVIMAGNHSRLVTIALVYLGILVLRSGLGVLTGYTLSYLAERVAYDLRSDVFAHLQKMSLNFFDKNPVGRLVTRVTNDIAALNEFVHSLVMVFHDVIRIILLLGVLFYLDVRLTLIGLAVIPVFAVITWYFKNKMRQIHREVRRRLARINAYVQESISGIRITQIFQRQKKNFQRFESINNDHFQSLNKAITYHAWLKPTVTTLDAISICLIIYFGGQGVLAGAVSVGVLYVFFNLVRRFYEPIRDLSERYVTFQMAMASAERVFDLLDTEPEVKDVVKPEPLPEIKGRIEFQHVWFSYPSNGNDYVLKDVSFSIQPGESVAIVGMTGGGKSTIINLLSRFYDIARGRILVDGVDISQVRQGELRRMLGIIQQDVFLFSGNMIDNIKLSEPEISPRRVKAAARYVNAHTFIETLPEGYFAPVEERGVTLSAGQRQLISFARALVFNPKILILDEATSSIDVETERIIQSAIRKLIRNRTSIIIAHRLSTIQNVNRIMVVHHGEIIESGTHTELLAERGLYYKLCQIQYQQMNGN